MTTAWERQRSATAEGMEVEILHDVTQMALAIITAAAFGFPVRAAYGNERHQPHTPEEQAEGRGKRYELSFTRCMEVVSQRTLPKVLLPAWALRLPVFGLREVGVAYRVSERACAREKRPTYAFEYV